LPRKESRGRRAGRPCPATGHQEQQNGKGSSMHIIIIEPATPFNLRLTASGFPSRTSGTF